MILGAANVFIPALTGNAPEGYKSIDHKILAGFDGSPVAETTITPPLLVHSLARVGPGNLQALSIDRILKIFRGASRIFADGRPDGLHPEEYVRNAALTSGLPLAAVRRNTLRLFPMALRGMDRFLKAQSPGGLKVFDKHSYKAGGISIGFAPRGRTVGFVMPGNHPSTHFMWLGALAMKMRVIVRPSEDDVFTPYRLATSLLAAGLPEDALAFLPGEHDLADAIVSSCSLSVLFGMQHLKDRYAAQPNVKVFGPGRSKVIVPGGADPGAATDMICRMVMDDAGRGCINASAVIVEGDAASLASAVAAALERTPVVSPLEEDAQLAALRSPAEADNFNRLIDRGLAQGGRELTPGRERRVQSAGGGAVMRPTVIEVPSCDHPLFGIELPFPFVVFVRTSSREETLGAARNSLVVAVAGDDPGLARDLLLDPTISKVYSGGVLSTEFDPREPHEGFLVDFLFEKKAFRDKSRWLSRS